MKMWRFCLISLLLKMLTRAKQAAHFCQVLKFCFVLVLKNRWRVYAAPVLVILKEYLAQSKLMFSTFDVITSTSNGSHSSIILYLGFKMRRGLKLSNASVRLISIDELWEREISNIAISEIESRRAAAGGRCCQLAPIYEPQNVLNARRED